MSARCPTCDRLLSADSPKESRPFCSTRCQLIDLGRWLDGDYAIPGPPAEDAPPPEADPEPNGR